MPRGYSRDLRERVLRAAASGLSAGEIQHHLGVSPSSLQRWKRTRRLNRSLDPGRSPGPSPKTLVAHEAALRAQVAAQPDATLADDRLVTLVGTLPELLLARSLFKGRV